VVLRLELGDIIPGSVGKNLEGEGVLEVKDAIPYAVIKLMDEFDVRPSFKQGSHDFLFNAKKDLKEKFQIRFTVFERLVQIKKNAALAGIEIG
jgi:hypothetical protein